MRNFRNAIENSLPYLALVLLINRKKTKEAYIDN